MRLVLATDNFSSPGGSETYLLTVAEQLMKLGHDVEIFANQIGEMSAFARNRGLIVCGDVHALTGAPDVIISQDGIVSYTLSDHWPNVPQIFVNHSVLFELQTPPLIPGIVSAVVVMSDRFQRWVEALDTKFRVVRLRQPIDIDRFKSRRTPRKRPERVLLLGNYLDGEARRILSEAWSPAGVSFTQIGKTTSSLMPEEAINDADIVVGKARAILDGMACGRPAYVYDVFGTDGWVTPQTYEAMEAGAFSGLATPRVTDMNQLRRDLDAYDPHMGIANRELVTIHHHAREHAQQLVELCGDLALPSRTETTPKREMARLVKAAWNLEAELFHLRGAMAPTADRAAEASENNARLQAELSTAKGDIDRLTGDLTLKDAEIARAQSERASALSRVEFAQTQIADLTEQIIELTGHVADLTGQAANLAGQVDASEAKLHILENSRGVRLERRVKIIATRFRGQSQT